MINQFKNCEPTIRVNEMIDKEQCRIQFFRQLLDIINDLGRNLDLNILLEKILDASIELMEAEQGYIFLANAEGVLEVKIGRTKNRNGIKVDNSRYSNSVVQKVLETQKVLFFPNVADEVDFSQCQSVINLELRSVICAPIGRRYNSSSQDRKKYPFLTAMEGTGIIYIDSTKAAQKSNFVGTNLNLFQALVDQASTAILNTMLHESANVDHLTGLYLRSYFEANLEFELEYSAQNKFPLSIIMIDIDFFKLINDRYGHPVGDAALKTFGHVLQETFGQNILCGRYGGDDFIVIVPRTDLEQAIRLVYKFQMVISKTKFASGTLTVSMGISNFPRHFYEYQKEQTRKTLINYADHALAAAKRRGRNRYMIWSTALQNATTDRSSVKDFLTGNPIRDYRNVEMLLSVIQSISKNIGKIDLLQHIVNQVIATLDADRGLILKYNENIRMLEIFCCCNREQSYQANAQHYSRKITEMVFASGANICINTIPEELQTQSIAAMELQSIMCVPLNRDTRRLGVFYFDSRKELKEFNLTELSFIKAIAIQLSMLMKMEVMV